MVLRIRGLADTVLSAHDKFTLSKYKELVCQLPAMALARWNSICHKPARRRWSEPAKPRCRLFLARSERF